jgi:hypothetical protein
MVNAQHAFFIEDIALLKTKKRKKRCLGHGLHLPLTARVYMFDEAPATKAPTASLVSGPSFFRIPGLAWSKRVNSKMPFAPAM